MKGEEEDMEDHFCKRSVSCALIGGSREAVKRLCKWACGKFRDYLEEEDEEEVQPFKLLLPRHRLLLLLLLLGDNRSRELSHVVYRMATKAGNVNKLVTHFH